MSCFGGRVSQDLYQNCCNANVLCEFDGDMSRVVSEPIYVQKVYDAVLVHLQGMKTVPNQSFVPALPCGHRVKRVIDIRCRRSFNPPPVPASCSPKQGRTRLFCFLSYSFASSSFAIIFIKAFFARDRICRTLTTVIACACAISASLCSK